MVTVIMTTNSTFDSNAITEAPSELARPCVQLLQAYIPPWRRKPHSLHQARISPPRRDADTGNGAENERKRVYRGIGIYHIEL